MTRTNRTHNGAGSHDSRRADTGRTGTDPRRIDIDDDDQTDAWLVEASRRLEEPDRDIAHLISSITGKLGRVRRVGRTLDTDDDMIRVSDRVVKQLLATRIRHALGRLVVLVELDSPNSPGAPDTVAHDSGAEDSGAHDSGSERAPGRDAKVSRVRIGLIARYHDDLVADSDRVREVADAVLASTLGSETTALARQHIDILWQALPGGTPRPIRIMLRQRLSHRAVPNTAPRGSSRGALTGEPLRGRRRQKGRHGGRGRWIG